MLALMGLIFSSGCATTKQSVLLGASASAVTGAAGAAVLNERNQEKHAAMSALVFGIIGGVAGYYTHQGLEKRDARVRKETLFNLEKFGVSGFSGNETTDGDDQYLIITEDGDEIKSIKRNQSN